MWLDVQPLPGGGREERGREGGEGRGLQTSGGGAQEIYFSEQLARDLQVVSNFQNSHKPSRLLFGVLVNEGRHLQGFTAHTCKKTVSHIPRRQLASLEREASSLHLLQQSAQHSLTSYLLRCLLHRRSRRAGTMGGAWTIIRRLVVSIP